MVRDSGKKRDIEPIFAISVVVFLVASVAVIGVFIEDRYIRDAYGELPEITAGSVVEVDYTGSLYNYYDRDGSLIFDTSVKQNSIDYPTIAGYNKTSYSTFKVTPEAGRTGTFEKGIDRQKVGIRYAWSSTPPTDIPQPTKTSRKP